jgi:hypothetical protein
MLSTHHDPPEVAWLGAVVATGAEVALLLELELELELELPSSPDEEDAEPPSLPAVDEDVPDTAVE